MARIALPWPSTCTGAVPRLYGCLFLLIPLLLAAGCAWHRSYPVPPEVTDAGVADRVLVPPDLNVNPVETVVKPGMPARPRSNPSSSHGLEPDRTTFALADAIAFALQYSPRLRSARAAIEQAAGPGAGGLFAFLAASRCPVAVRRRLRNPGPRHTRAHRLHPRGQLRHARYSETEVALQWTVYDFGRTGGSYRQAVAHERIAELQLVRADQTVEFDVAAAYLDVLLARGIPPGARGRRPPGRGDPGRHGGPAQGRRRAPGGRAACPGPAVGEPRRPGPGPGRGAGRAWPA